MSARQPQNTLAWPIRPAGPGDTDAIQALMVAATIRSIWPTLDAQARDPVLASYARAGLRQRLGDGQHHFWVALDAEGGDPCGVIALNGARKLQYLFVRPRWQRSGVGRALWQVAREHALKLQADPAPFTVNASLNAVPAYEKLGFVADGAAQDEGGWRWQPMLAQV